MKKNVLLALASVALALLLCSCASQEQQKTVYTGMTVPASYSYHLAGGHNWVAGFAIKVDNAAALKNPGLVFLASGIEKAGQALLKVNGKEYTVPPMDIDFSGKASAAPASEGGKAVFYADERGGADVIAKIVVPLKPEDVKSGVNQVEFTKSGADGYEISSAQIESVTQTQPGVIGQTYHLLARGRPANMRDFDGIYNLKQDEKYTVDQVPQWSIRGKVNFYRSGMAKNTDRMFEMFKEAKVNLVNVGGGYELNSEAYTRTKAMIDRLHAAGIKALGFNSLGGVALNTWLANPLADAWVARDEYGNRMWREKGGSYVSDVSSPSYRKSVLEHAGIQMDAGVDELYYDYGLGGTADVRTLFQEIRALAKSKGKHIGVFGNCKGNIMVDEMGDLVKSEGTEEPGVWDGKWVTNIPQARCYYAISGGKRYESKWEGADPGVPNPGAHDVRDGMKAGWKRNIAEACAFQSDYAIAESGPKLLEGWASQSHPLGVQTWKDVSTYFSFKADNQELLSDISTVSKVGILAPPLIPSFEVKLRRQSLYEAMAEMSLMYEIVFLHHATPEALSRYKAIIIADIPWMDASQTAAVEAFKKAGGKIYTIGSAKKFRDMADIASPAELFQGLDKPENRRTLATNVRKLEGEPLVAVGEAKYVIANLAKKNKQNRFILHLVNYDKPVKNVRVTLNLDGVTDGIDAKGMKLLSPDGVPKELKIIKATPKAIEFVVPALDTYNIVTL